MYAQGVADGGGTQGCRRRHIESFGGPIKSKARMTRSGVCDFLQHQHVKRRYLPAWPSSRPRPLPWSSSVLSGRAASTRIPLSMLIVSLCTGTCPGNDAPINAILWEERPSERMLEVPWENRTMDVSKTINGKTPKSWSTRSSSAVAAAAAAAAASPHPKKYGPQELGHKSWNPEVL